MLSLKEDNRFSCSVSPFCFISVRLASSVDLVKTRDTWGFQSENACLGSAVSHVGCDGAAADSLSLSHADSEPADRFTPSNQTRLHFQSLKGETGQNRQQNSNLWLGEDTHYSF